MLHVVDPEVSAALVLGDGGTEPPVMTEWLDARQPADAVRPEMLIRKGEPHTEILAAAEAGDDEESAVMAAIVSSVGAPAGSMTQ